MLLDESCKEKPLVVHANKHHAVGDISGDGIIRGDFNADGGSFYLGKGKLFNLLIDGGGKEEVWCFLVSIFFTARMSLINPRSSM